MGGYLDNAGMLAALRHLEPSKPFRSAYQYQNLMYLVAGIVLERISGQRWENFIRDRILLPLGMERATTSLEEMVERHSDYAAPHAVLDGVQQRIPARPINTRSGGGICASIVEMAAYMGFHLDPIAGRGSLRLSPGAVAELTAPQIFIGRSDFSEFRDRHYGFGFDVGHYRGARCLDHGGGWSGYNCDLRLLPDHGSGVMVLTNGHDPGCAPLTYGAMDHLLGLEPLPWLERLSRPRATMGDRKLKDRSAREEACHRDTRPSHALADYANEYAHPAYGSVRISCNGDVLRWQGLGFDLPMVHRHYDVFEIAPEPAAWFENKTVQFATGVEGHVESLAVPLEPAVAPIVFRRLPEPEMATRAFLEPLTGIYRYGTVVFRIEIDGAGRLTFTRNEAATERLLSRHGNIFGFADSEFFRIEFRRNATGEVNALLSHEPSGTYLAERDAAPR